MKIHKSAQIAECAKIGEGSTVWSWVQIRERVVIGENCVVSKGVYLDSDVSIGNQVKIQNNVSVFSGVTIEDGVFVGPHACFTNDMAPRAITPDGKLKLASDWTVTPTLIRFGASIGANCTIRCGITIGKWAMVGAGSVVTKDIPDFALVVGNPAVIRGYVCVCGRRNSKKPIGYDAKCSCADRSERLG